MGGGGRLLIYVCSEFFLLDNVFFILNFTRALFVLYRRFWTNSNFLFISTIQLRTSLHPFHRIHRIHGIHEFLGREVTQLSSQNSRNSWIPGWRGDPAQFTEFTEFMNSLVGTWRLIHGIHEFLGGEVTQLNSQNTRISLNSWIPGWGGWGGYGIWTSMVYATVTWLSGI